MQVAAAAVGCATREVATSAPAAYYPCIVLPQPSEKDKSNFKCDRGRMLKDLYTF